MVTLFIWGGGYQTSYSYKRTYSSEAKRGEVPHRVQRKLLGGLSLGHQSSPGHQVDVFFLRLTTLLLTWRDPMISPVSWEMITSTDLLELEIYEIQEVWTRWKELRYTHHAMRSLPKGLQFFDLVSPSESLKVMGLKGIHHSNTLCYHAGLSYCPWCRKEGQNKGTMVNHLQTIYYKLGLVCSGCLCHSTTTSEAIQCHGQACKHSDTKQEDGRPGNDDSSTSD